MTHASPNPAPPVVLSSRGERFCSSCKRPTMHTVRTVLSGVGKALMVASVVITVALIVHFLRIIPDRFLLLLLCCGLSVVFGTVIFCIALRRKSYQVRCEQCSRETLLLSPPRWTTGS